MAKILDATIEEQKALAKAMQQLHKDAAKLTDAQRKLLSEWGKIGKVSAELKKELDLLKTYEKLFAARNDAQKDFNQLLKLQNDMRDVELQLTRREREEKEKEYLEARDNEKATREAHIKLKKELEERREELEEITNLHAAAAAEGLGSNKREDKERARTALHIMKMTTAIFDDEEKIVDAALDAHQAARKILDVKTEQIGQAQLQEELDTKRNNSLDNIETGTRSLFKTFTGVTDQSDSFVGSLIQSRQLTGDWGAATKKIKDVYKGTFTSLNIGLGLLSKVFQSTLMFMKEFDKLAADFRKNTGIIDRGFLGIEQRIVNVQRANIRMGVSMDEAFQAAGSLTSEMASFTGMTDKSQASVLQAATVLQEFGVGAQTTAQIFNNFSKGLGYNANQLERLSTQLMGISTSLKIPPQIIATEFNAASKELMKYGGDMVNVFKGIAEQSKQTGIAMGELLGIVKQFDTFEGAGAAVGKLNAILGGPYLNSINMLYATEEDRVKMLRESVALSGKQFNELSRFEKQAIAAAAGITDMTVAGNLFGGTSSEFAKTQMSMKEMQERAAKAQSVTEKFTQVMQSFAIALGPVVHALGAVADALVVILNPLTEIFNIESDLGGFLDSMIAGVYLLAGAFIFLEASTLAALAPFVVAIGIFTGLLSITKGLSAGMKILAGSLFMLVSPLIAVGAAAALAMAPFTIGASVVMWTTAAAGISAFAAGLVTTVQGIGEYAPGKPRGQSVGGGAALVGEKGSEMVVTEDGSRYMVDSPSVIALDKNDTVYSNAETKAMLSNGSSNDNGAAIAEMRQMIGELARSQQQQSAAADRRVEAMLDRPVVVAVNDKKLFETMKPQLNRALGLSRTGGVV